MVVGQQDKLGELVGLIPQVAAQSRRRDGRSASRVGLRSRYRVCRGCVQLTCHGLLAIRSIVSILPEERRRVPRPTSLATVVHRAFCRS